MPSVKADRNRCDGYGNCSELAPNIFGVDEGGLVIVLRGEISQADMSAALGAVRSCPAGALALSDDTGSALLESGPMVNPHR